MIDLGQTAISKTWVWMLDFQKTSSESFTTNSSYELSVYDEAIYRNVTMEKNTLEHVRSKSRTITRNLICNYQSVMLSIS